MYLCNHIEGLHIYSKCIDLPGGPPAAGDVGPEVLARLGVARRLLEAAVVGEDSLRETVSFIWRHKLSGSDVGEK